jgi:hypothetical protein
MPHLKLIKRRAPRTESVRIRLRKKRTVIFCTFFAHFTGAKTGCPENEHTA